VSSIGFETKRKVAGYLGQRDNWKFQEIPYEVLEDRNRFGRFVFESDEAESRKAQHFLRADITSSHFLNVIDFPDGEWSKASPQVMQNVLKLIVAIDFGVEPNIGIFNIDSNYGRANLLGAIAKINKKSRDERLNYKIDGLAEQQCSDVDDSSDFVGHSIDNPRHFRIFYEQGACRLALKGEDRDAVMAKSELHESAHNEPDELPLHDHELASAPSGYMSLLAVFAKAQGFTSITGEKWLAMRISSVDTPGWLKGLRKTFGERLHLERGQAAAWQIDHHEILVSAKQDVFEEALSAMEASRELERAIYNEGEQAEHKEFLREIFARGADFKYIDPAAARGGKTFKDLMMQKQRYRMVEALNTLAGNRDADLDLG